MKTPPQMFDVAVDSLSHKSYAPLIQMMIAATSAGFLIGLGFVFYTTSQVGASELPYGLAKLIGGVVFTGGLMSVIITGSDLFTSTSMTPLLVARKQLSMAGFARHWGIVYLFNMVGAGLLAVLISLSDVAENAGGEWGGVLASAAVSKLSHPWMEAFILGIACNLLVCLAVWMSFAGTSVIDKCFIVIFPIALFVATGFEHSVANMFIIPAAILTKNQAIVAPEAGLDSLTWANYLTDNLIPVTLGNVVAGVSISLVMQLWHGNSVSRIAGAREAN